MSDRVRWGVLGNANIARVCVIPAIQKSRNGRVHALATRSPERSREVLATVEAGFITALRQTYAIVGTRGAIEMPHDAFIPWERDAVFSLRGREDEQGSAQVTPGEDEYQLMVEHFSDVVRGSAQLACPPAESVANMRVLDALAESARAGHPVSL